MLDIRWEDISAIPTEGKLNQRINRQVYIPVENAKTGKSRSVGAHIAGQFKRIGEQNKNAKSRSITMTTFLSIYLRRKEIQTLPINKPLCKKD